MTLSIERFLPSDEELESGPRRPPEPSEAEKLDYLRRLLVSMGARRPNDLAESILPETTWTANSLWANGERIHAYVRRCAYERPEDFKPDGTARIDDTLNLADQQSDASLLCTVKLRTKFAERYGPERLGALRQLQRRGLGSRYA